MFRCTCKGLLTTGLVLFLFATRAIGDESAKEKADETARTLVRAFLKELEAKNVKELMKIVDVPWLGEKKGIIKQTKEIEKDLLRQADQLTKAKLKLDVGNPIEYSDYGKEMEEESRKLLDQVLTKNDLVVIVTSLKPLSMRYVLVRMQGEQPKVVGGPYPFTYLLINNRIPDSLKEALTKAEQIELVSLEPKGFESKQLGKTVIKEAAQRKQVAKAFLETVETSEGMHALCFNPRHAIRFTHDKKTYNIVICFECMQAQVFEGDKPLKDLYITESAQPTFDKILSDAKVPLAERPNKK
jgi:hypothetical protein